MLMIAEFTKLCKKNYKWKSYIKLFIYSRETKKREKYVNIYQFMTKSHLKFCSNFPPLFFIWRYLFEFHKICPVQCKTNINRRKTSMNGHDLRQF